MPLINGNFTFTIYDGNMPGPGAIGDANNDGFLDVFNGSNLYQNNGNENNWIKVTTTGTTSNINGIGARVEISSPGIGTQIRDVRSGTGFRYMGSLNTYFGLGLDESITTLTIYWPSGTIDILNNVAVNQEVNVVEGQTLSIENTTTQSLNIYPNPVENFINIESDINLTGTIISVFDINGRRTLNYKKASSSNQIDVSGLSTGEYILRIVTSEGAIYTNKIIKR